MSQLRGNLDEAAKTYGEIRDMLESQAPRHRKRLAVVHHQLGTVAKRRGRLGEAEEWYRKALGILEELGDKLGVTYIRVQLF